MRLIYADDVKEKIIKSLPMPKTIEESDCNIACIAMANNWVDSIPTAYVSVDWHAPTIDNPDYPPEGDIVIVSVHDTMGDTPFDYVSTGWITPDHYWWVVDNEINNYVIAWAYLPKPYKEKNN